MSINCNRLRKLLPRAKVSAKFVDDYIGAHGQITNRASMELDIEQAMRLLSIFTLSEILSVLSGSVAL